MFVAYVADMHGCDVVYHEYTYGERPVLNCGEIDVEKDKWLWRGCCDKRLSMTWDERSVRYVIAHSVASIGLIDVLVQAEEKSRVDIHT